MSGAILRPIQDIGRGAAGAIGGAVGAIADNPWLGTIHTPLASIPLWQAASNALFPPEKPLPGESEEARMRRERAKRLASMSNSLASQDSQVLSSITNEDLKLLSPEQGASIASRRDTILTRRAMPGRAQTILANENQRY